MEWEVVKVEHTESDNVTLVPRRCRLEEIRESERIGANGIWLARFDDFSPLMAHNFIGCRDISVRKE